MYYETAAHEECKTEEYNREGGRERRTQRRGKGRDGKVRSFHRNKLKKNIESWIRLKLLQADTERDAHTHTVHFT